MSQPGEVIFEFVRLGSFLKVIAIDAASGIEVSAVVPVTTRPPDAQRLALQKLRRKLAHPHSPLPDTPPEGGIVV